MTLVFKNQKGFDDFERNAINNTNNFIERKTTMEINGEIYNKDTLSKNNESVVPVYKGNGWVNSQNVINTNRKSYDFAYHGLLSSYLPFNDENTLLDSEVIFEDGTVIRQSNNQGMSYDLLFSQRFGENIANLQFMNTYARTPLVKVDEGSFIAVRNIFNYLYFGKNYSNSYDQSTINYTTSSLSKRRFTPVKNNYSSDSYLNGFWQYLTTASNTGDTSLTTGSTGYNTTTIADTLTLFDKNLNILKEVMLPGELINVLDRKSDGSLFILVQTYNYNSTSKYSSDLKVMKVTPTLVLTSIYTETIKRPYNDSANSTPNFFSQIPHYDRNTKKLTFLNAVSATYFKQVILNVEEDKVTQNASITIANNLFSRSFNSYTDFFLNTIKIYINKITVNNVDYYYVGTLFSNLLETAYNDYKILNTNATYSGNTNFNIQRTGANLYMQALNYHSGFDLPIYLFTLNDANSAITPIDIVSNVIAPSNSIKAILPVGKEFFLVVKDNGLTLYTINSATQKVVIKESVSSPIRSVGVDSNNRIWFIRDDNNSNFEMISPYLSLDVFITFEDTNLVYSSDNIDTAINVEAKDLSGTRQELEIKLNINGNAFFRDNQKKTITVTTNASQPLRIPIVVNGSGAIDILTTVDN